MKNYRKSLFIFRRDLRLEDNIGLNAALKQSQEVLACFVFDPRQIELHPYQSRPGLMFMLQALRDLQQKIAGQGGALYLFSDKPERVIDRLKKEQQIEAVFVNSDYTPFSRQRDADLHKYCASMDLSFVSHGDLLLNEPKLVLKSDESPYQVFTAFYNRARQIPVAFPQPLAARNFINGPLASEEPDWLDHYQSQGSHNVLLGGRSAAMAILNDTLPKCADYLQQRDFPAQAATSFLSAYLKFGCCSVREAFYATVNSLDNEHAMLRQYYWRDFFTHIAFHFPYVFGHAFHRRYDAIPWQNDEEKFRAWANGRTGFPIVDAAMRELQQTGWMHNRLRMITASFLVKDLHISWRWGERYFAQHLIDYDPCVNNGNWQWAASTGCDAQPYFRIFNPWLQQLKFDADCRYIKRWLPELENIPAKTIHQWQQKSLACGYPPPIVDHSLQSRRIKDIFQSISSQS